MEKSIITRTGKRNGQKTVTIAAEYRNAAASLKIWWKDYRPWMLKVEEAVKAGKPVAAAELLFMAELGSPRATAEQSELLAELRKVLKRRRAA